MTNNCTTINSENVLYRVLRPEDLQLLKPSVMKKSKRGRPPRRYTAEEDFEEVIDDFKNVSPLKMCRTRSGRMSKPPKHITEEDDQKSDDIQIKPEVESSYLQQPIRKRKITSQIHCNTCKKAFLCKSRLTKHLQLNPGHVAVTPLKLPNEDDLWSDLMRRVQKSDKQQSQRLCEEFIRFLYRARTVIPKLLKPVQESEAYFEIDQVTGNALGVPDGKYMLTEMDEDNNDLNNCTVDVMQIKSNDQNSLVNLLVDTGQDTFDSSVSAASEEVINVDQLVNERLKTFTNGGAAELSPTNCSQNLNLDLSSLDTMFSYHTS